MELPSAEELGHALAVFGNWRVIHTQEACYPYTPIPASVMLALGFRESSLENICGGAKLVNGVWVPSFTDRGCFQISDQVDREREWLAKQEGCPDGAWSPNNPAAHALDPMHVPRFSPALDFTKATMIEDMAFAKQGGVPQEWWLRFAVAAHNAGPTGALQGYRAGDIDLHTAHGNYSQFVLDLAPMVHEWITQHPNWTYKP